MRDPAIRAASRSDKLRTSLTSSQNTGSSCLITSVPDLVSQSSSAPHLAPPSSSCEEIKSFTPSISKSSLVSKLGRKLQAPSLACQTELLTPLLPGSGRSSSNKNNVTPSSTAASSSLVKRQAAGNMDHLLSDQPLNLSSKKRKKSAVSRLMTSANLALLENESKFFSSLKEKLLEAASGCSLPLDDSFRTSSAGETNSISSSPCFPDPSSPLDLSSKMVKNADHSDSSISTISPKVASESASANASLSGNKNGSQSKKISSKRCTSTAGTIAATEYRHKKWQMKRTSNNQKVLMITRTDPLSASDAGSPHSSTASDGNHLLMSTDSLDSPNGTSVSLLFSLS